jgi:hypothetical protein
MGTCRDFAHLGIALCRATGVPARFAAVYAPGLTPMDFHAVFESFVNATAGSAELETMEVSATVGTFLPTDDSSRVVRLA